MDSESLYVNFKNVGPDDSNKYARAMRDYLAVQAAARAIEIDVRVESAKRVTARLKVAAGAHVAAVRGWVKDWQNDNPGTQVDVTDADDRSIEPPALPPTGKVQTPTKLPDLDFRLEFNTGPFGRNRKKGDKGSLW
jgi:hypothetical protein